MNPSRKSVRHLSGAAAAGMALTLSCLTSPAAAVEPSAPPAPAGVQLDHLDRGLVAAGIPEGVFLSWRLLGHEATGSTATGLTGTDFAVYRDGQKLATVTDSTNYLDAGGTAASAYEVRAVVGGVELDRSATATAWAGNFKDIALKKPADGVTPAGQAYTYAANDASVADVDGDGQYEFIVKWDPNNSKDVSQVGYTGNTYVDTYKADGTLLHRIDLGVNIRSGAHYTQLLVNDFDGDGRAEMMMKTAPGTRTIPYKDGTAAGDSFISLLQQDIDAGYSHADDYRMSAADYYQHMVDTFQGWTEHPEVKAGNWPATLEEAFGIAPQYQYPLSRTDAEAVTDYFMDVYAPSRSARNNLRAFEGFIVSGPEYLTVFEGATGKELKTVAYAPGRHDDGLMWGDYAMARIEPGNRVDRFLAGVAYLDGQKPAAVFARGYYTRTTLASYTWDGTTLSPLWNVDSGWAPMTNPFNDSPHGRDGSDPVFGKLTTQGFHSLSASDVDGDGKQEIVYGAATIDDDGSLLYSSFDTMPAGSATPGEEARLGHGDAMHVTDIDPARPGKEIFTVHEGGTYAPYGYAMRDASDGKVLFGAYSGKDTGRGMIGDVDPAVPGIENWAIGMRSADGRELPGAQPGTNMSIKWAADMTTQIINGSGDQTPTIDDVKRGRLLTADGTRTNNGTKGTPSLVADVVGDWREEMLVRTADSSALRMYLSTEVTNHKLYTLMHDPQYRAEVARQNTTYNQPSYTDFYFASDMDFGNVPLRAAWLPGSVKALQYVLEDLTDSGDVSGPVASQLTASVEQAQKAVADGDSAEAGQAIQRFVDFLGQQKNPDNVSEAARSVLGYNAGNILRAFEG
ncbi:rhamnogalacturonan lyase [Arthrobacter sp. CDRTa11]|uniref:rhamnogalacturonan lyase n=1 Tax=Arthrobacter sp. CDRTa11 TaxID=2651199 RepID=UPI0022659891|nr:rhamnogalacturonan lyase [Arthrobacter sp. CDRTa11]UZX01590.1 rhamnogalacturonan lyase [Arthrobacter sp. CDRTa11]